MYMYMCISMNMCTRKHQYRHVSVSIHTCECLCSARTIHLKSQCTIVARLSKSCNASGNRADSCKSKLPPPVFDNASLNYGDGQNGSYRGGGVPSNTLVMLWEGLRSNVAVPQMLFIRRPPRQSLKDGSTNFGALSVQEQSQYVSLSKSWKHMLRPTPALGNVGVVTCRYLSCQWFSLHVYDCVISFGIMAISWILLFSFETYD